MNTYIKTWVTNIIFIQAFFIFKVFSEEIAHPTYSEFLDKFPDGYPEFIDVTDKLKLQQMEEILYTLIYG